MWHIKDLGLLDWDLTTKETSLKTTFVLNKGCL